MTTDPSTLSGTLYDLDTFNQNIVGFQEVGGIIESIHVNEESWRCTTFGLNGALDSYRGHKVIFDPTVEAGRWFFATPTTPELPPPPSVSPSPLRILPLHVIALAWGEWQRLTGQPGAGRFPVNYHDTEGHVYTVESNAEKITVILNRFAYRTQAAQNEIGRKTNALSEPASRIKSFTQRLENTLTDADRKMYKQKLDEAEAMVSQLTDEIAVHQAQVAQAEQEIYEFPTDILSCQFAELGAWEYGSRSIPDATA